MPELNNDLATRHRQREEDDVLFPAEGMETAAQGHDSEEPREGEAEEEESREVRAPTIPVTPSRAEVLQHRLKHHPFRSWCPHCVRGKGREDRHLRSAQKDEYQGIPKLASDYFFIGRRRPSGRQERDADEEEAAKEGQTPILVIKDVKSKAIFAHACPCKGAHEAVVSKVIEDLNSLGYRRVLVRTDGEPAIVDLWKKIKEQWWGEIVKVESMAGDHDSNGDAEQAVQKVEDEVRTWLDATNDSIKDRIPPHHPILAWMVEHAMSIYRRTYVGTDGKTPIEHIRGRRGRDLIASLLKVCSISRSVEISLIRKLQR